MSSFSGGLNFRQLEIFSAVVETGSTTRSAAKLGLSQPAVSRNVSQLETDLGFELFNRSGGRLVPTEDALRLYAEVSKAYSGIENVVRSTRDKDAPVTGKVRIAAVPAVSLSFLSKAVRGFVEDHREVNLQFETRTSRMAVEMVANQQVDLGIVSLPIAHKGVKLETLTTPPAVCMMPAKHDLVNKQEITIRDLEGHSIIPLSRNHNSRHRLEELFADEGITPDIRIETSTAAMACSLVGEGLGVTIVNAITAQSYISEDVVARPFQHAMNYAYAIATPTNIPSSEPAKIFVSYFKEYLSNILEG